MAETMNAQQVVIQLSNDAWFHVSKLITATAAADNASVSTQAQENAI